MAPKTTKTKGRPTATKAAAKVNGNGKSAGSKAAGGSAPTGKASTGKAEAGSTGKGAAGKAAAGKAAAGKAAAGKAKPAPKGKASAKAPASKKGEGGKKTEARNAKLKAIREAAAKADAADADSDESKRNFGLRGAAPWVARHAAKHAEELRKRNAEPPPPGSARATLRTPKEAEEIKGKVALLHQRIGTINTLRKKLDKSFFEIGELLGELQTNRLFEAKGYATFESFLDREIEIPRPQAIKLVRIVHTFDREAAHDYPLERLMNALSALDGEPAGAAPSQAAASSRTLVGSSRSFPAAALPPKPPIRWD
jgi:hypothetical protein